MLQRLFCLGSISVAMGRAFQEVIVGVINCGLVLHGGLCVGVGVRVFVCARKSLMTVSEPWKSTAMLSHLSRFSLFQDMPQSWSIDRVNDCAASWLNATQCRPSISSSIRIPPSSRNPTNRLTPWGAWQMWEQATPAAAAMATLPTMPARQIAKVTGEVNRCSCQLTVSSFLLCIRYDFYCLFFWDIRPRFVEIIFTIDTCLGQTNTIIIVCRYFAPYQ